MVLNSLGFQHGHRYVVTAKTGAFSSVGGHPVPASDNIFVFTTSAGNYTVADPSLSPPEADGSEVDVTTTSIVFTFQEKVYPATLSLLDLSNNVNLNLNPTPSGGTASLAVSYSVSLSSARAYRLTLTANSFSNIVGVNYPVVDTTYTFVCTGAVNPVLSSTTPIDGLSGQPSSLRSIDLDFNQNMKLSAIEPTAFAFLRDLSHNSLMETIDLKEPTTVFDGSRVTVAWTTSLSDGARYNFEIPANTFTTLGGQPYGHMISVDFITIGKNACDVFLLLSV